MKGCRTPNAECRKNKYIDQALFLPNLLTQMDIEPLLPQTVDKQDKKRNQFVCVILGLGNLFVLVTLLIVLVPNSRVYRIEK